MIDGGRVTKTKKTATDFAAQVAIRTHLSHADGDVDFDGQHGMSSAMSSAKSSGKSFIATALSDTITWIDAGATVSAIADRDNGVKAIPTIVRIASNRRMKCVRFTASGSHTQGRKYSLTGPCPAIV